MQKVDGVQRVEVRLNDGVTVLDFKPGNDVTLATLRHVIKNNGFVSKEALVVAAGTDNGDRVFVVSGTQEQLELTSAPQRLGDSWRMTVSAPAR
jgi:hypothetical protein